MEIHPIITALALFGFLHFFLTSLGNEEDDRDQYLERIRSAIADIKAI